MAELKLLPPISCDGCGSCCTTMSAPQYGWYFASAPDRIPEWRKDTADYRFIQAMPDDVQKELAEFYAGDAKKDWTMAPCLWLDPETKRCRNYQWRPMTCRTFQTGGYACRNHRESFLIDLPTNGSPSEWWKAREAST